MESDPDIPVRQEIEKLVERLSPEDRKLIATMSASDLIKLHHGYGTWLRNQFRRNEYPHLFRFCSAKVPSEQLSFDAISAEAIHRIRLHLRSN
jgi:uncharacterized protein DUF6794